MHRILLYGNNIVTKFLQINLKKRGFIVEVIKNLSDISDDKKSETLSIIDTTNVLVRNDEDDEMNFLHNTSDISQLLKICEKNECPLLFLYRDSTDLKPEASLFTALEIIDKYNSSDKIDVAKIIIEDIYGPNINTSDRLKNFIESMVGGYPLVVSDDNNDHYLFHEDDFSEGLLEAIKAAKSKTKYKTFTLFPEEPIIEIELAHFINSLSELPQEIEYSSDESELMHEVTIDVNYPGKWLPKIELEEGLINTLREMGIPIPEDALKELQTERERYFEDYYNLKSANNPASTIYSASDSTPTATKQDYTDDFVPLIDDEEEEKIDEKQTYDFDDIDKPDPYDKSSVNFDQYDNDVFSDKRPDDSDIFNLNNQKESVQDNYGFDYDSHLYGDNDSNLDANYRTKGSYYLIALLAIGLSAILLVPSMIYLKDFISGFNSLKVAAKSVENYEFDIAQDKSGVAIEKFKKLGDKRIPYPLVLVGKINNLEKDDLSELVSIYGTASNTVNYIALLGEESEAYTTNPTEGRVLGVSNTINTTDYLNKSLELLEQLKNDREHIEISNDFVDKNLFKIIDPLIGSNDKLSKLKTISPALDKLIGNTTAQRYLLVYQDTDEIRGTGGVIELYGILKIDRGKVTLENVQDARTLDDQGELNDVSISPSSDLADIFRVDRLSLRDASWNPDFSTSASQMKNLYETTTRDQVDGVISMNKNFLNNLGAELQLQQTTNNPTQSHSEYIASTSNLLKATIDQAFVPENSRELVSKLYEALNSKDLLLYHEDNAVLSSIMQNNWGGNLVGNYDDYLYVVDSNISRNKVNHNIVRKIEYEGLKPEENNYTRRILITYNNINEDMPINKYINHVRIYVPSDAGLNSAFLITGSDKKMITKDIKLNTIGNKAIYSTDITIDPQSQTTLLLEIDTPNKSYDDKTINLVVQKQPGNPTDDLSIRFIHTLSEINREKLDKSAIVENDTVFFNSDLNTDKTFNFPL